MDFIRALSLSMMPNPNRTITKCDGYFISYNPLTDVGPETALVVEKGGNNKYYILLGDHREQYKKCESLADCKKYFRANTDLKSGWSD
jgi:hypothetical protein